MDTLGPALASEDTRSGEARSSRWSAEDLIAMKAVLNQPEHPDP